MAELSDDRMAFYQAEYDRYFKRRDLWSALSNDHIRMRRLGGLQSQMDRVQKKAVAANSAIARLMKSYDVEVQQSKDNAAQNAIEQEERAELAPLLSHSLKLIKRASSEVRFFYDRAGQALGCSLNSGAQINSTESRA